ASTFEIVATVSNDGPSQSSGGTLTLPLPDELTLGAGSECTGADELSCPLTALAPGESKTVTIPLLVDADVFDGTRAELELVVESAEPDPQTGNDSAEIVVLLGDPIFFDGFESGDTSAWSKTLPNGVP
ncbi:MAG: hypothetical protein AAFY88_13750, partial [Acidobacteriota bacterium]